MLSHRILLALALAGLAFSGYLSSVKFFTATCALGETCPYFLGYPACYFGFIMYVILTLAAVLLVRTAAPRALSVMAGVSLLGILFAGYFTVGEIPVLLSDGVQAFVMGLPSCAWGLLMYSAIFIVTRFART